MADLYDDQFWGGTFFPPDHYSTRFTGKVEYSPSGGVVLHYRISEGELPPSSNVLYGELDDGMKCTLVGNFDAKNSSFRSIKMSNFSRGGKLGFKAIIIGDHVPDEKIVTKIDFTLNHLHSFFSSSPTSDNTKYDKDKPLQYRGKPGRVSAYQKHWSIPFSSSYVSNKVYSDDDESLSKLISAVKELESKASSPFKFTIDVEYRIKIEFDEPLTLKSAYLEMLKISDLFCLLMCEPVHPIDIRIEVGSESVYPFGLACYPSTRTPGETIRLCQRKLSRSCFPVNSDTVDINEIVHSWLNGNEADVVIIDGIRHETYERSCTTAYSEIVLFATQLEAISISEGKTKAKDRYTHPISRYSGDYIQTGLIKMFDVSGLEELAVCIGQLRGEITHAGRPKKWIEKLSLDKLVGVAHLLQLTILGFSISKLGVPKSVIDQYQKRNGPEL